MQKSARTKPQCQGNAVHYTAGSELNTETSDVVLGTTLPLRALYQQIQMARSRIVVLALAFHHTEPLAESKALKQWKYL